MSGDPRGSIADSLRVDHELQPDAPTRAVIAEMLGRTHPPPEQPDTDVPRVDPAAVERPSGGGSFTPATPERATWTPPALLGILAGVAAAGADAIRALRPTPRSRPAQLEVIDPPPNASAQWHAEVLGPPRPAAEPLVDPLLLGRWSTGILTLALSLDARDGPLDTDRLVESIARDEIPAQLPRRPHRTLSAGVQMLVDLSPGMQPYRADLVDIVTRVERVVGDGASVLRFAGDPLAAGPGRRDTWTAYRPPPTPRPVLVVSDLGLGSEPLLGPRQAAATWLRLCRIAHAAGCPVIALTPQRAGDVPIALRRKMAIIEWDRRTTAASAARAVRR